MAAAADKARFHLESSVTELREWERRDLFTRDEISAITTKRSAFEHTLNARGAATPAEWARYVSYEMNLDALRKKRVARKKMKATTQGHTSQQRIFSLLDRATKRFPDNLELWLQYIEYCRKQRSNKKISRILTDLLRLHPTQDHVWTYAAKWTMDVQGDVDAARSFFQRGLRFCPKSRYLYLEYARLEMGYIAKIANRRKILGLDHTRLQKPQTESLDNSMEADMIALPEITAEDMSMEHASTTSLDHTAIERLATTPAMTGAIPLAIFDAATKIFNSDEALCENFFNLFAEFGSVPCATRLMDHVISSLVNASPESVTVLSCRCRLPLAGVSISDPQYPSALRLMLKTLNASLSSAVGRESDLSQRLLSWLVPLANNEFLAAELKQVLEATIRRISKNIPMVQATT